MHADLFQVKTDLCAEQMSLKKGQLQGRSCPKSYWNEQRVIPTQSLPVV